MISEYAKRQSSWDKLRNTSYYENLIHTLSGYLISEDEKAQRENEKEIDAKGVEESVFVISQIRKMGLRFWDGFLKYIDENKPEGFKWLAAFEIVSKLKKNKNLTIHEISFGKKVLEYIEKYPLIIDEI